jgi:hypothetical protein
MDHIADAIWAGEVTSAIRVASIPCADSKTIWARRQVTTEPLLRRMIRNSRLPSSLLIARTRTLAAMIAPRAVNGRHGDSRSITTLPAGNEANVAGHGTSSPGSSPGAQRAREQAHEREIGVHEAAGEHQEELADAQHEHAEAERQLRRVG